MAETVSKLPVKSEVLTVSLPKAATALKPEKKITVKAA